MQDADESVAEAPQRVVVAGAAGAQGVVVGACSRRGVQRGERLQVAHVGQAPVAGESGGDDGFLAGGAGDRGGSGVVFACLGAGVAVGSIAELGQCPGAENFAEPGLGPVDLSVRVPAKTPAHLGLQLLGLAGELGDHRGQRPHAGPVGIGEYRGLFELVVAQRGYDRLGASTDIAYPARAA